MSYNIIKYATLGFGLFLLASGLCKARFEVSSELPMTDTIVVEKQYETVVVDTLPESKEYMLQTSYLSQP